MKTTISILVLLLVFGSGCSRATVDAGTEGVVVTKPYFFGHGGVQRDPIKTGAEFVAWTTDVIPVTITPITVDEVFDDIMPRDNNPVDYHAALQIRITNSVLLIEKFGVDWYKNNLQRPFQNMNRNQVRQYSMPELALEQTVVQHVEQALEAELRAYAKSIAIPVEVQKVSLGRISPQKSIIDAYNETGVQQQAAKTQMQRKLAEDARALAETSRAKADRAYQENLGVSVEQYIRLQQIEACRENQNCSLFLGATPTPIVNLK